MLANHDGVLCKVRWNYFMIHGVRLYGNRADFSGGLVKSSQKLCHGWKLLHLYFFYVGSILTWIIFRALHVSNIKSSLLMKIPDLAVDCFPCPFVAGNLRVRIDYILGPHVDIYIHGSYFVAFCWWWRPIKSTTFGTVSMIWPQQNETQQYRVLFRGIHLIMTALFSWHVQTFNENAF